LTLSVEIVSLHQQIYEGGFLDGGPSGFVGDSTRIVSDFQQDVARKSPVDAPTVANSVIWHRSGHVVSNELNAVVQDWDDVALDSAHHTRGVVLPSGSIYADGEGSPRDEVLLKESLSLEFSGGVSPAGDAGDDFGLAELARSVLGGVRIRRVALETTSANNVGIGSGRVSSTTAVIGGVAIDDLLRSEVDVVGGELSGQDVGGLNSLGGGEGPAASALLLVLNGSDGALLFPVDVARDVLELDARSQNVFLVLGGGETVTEAVQVLEFLGREVRKFVEGEDSIFFAASFAVEACNTSEGGLEILETQVLFGNVIVDLIVGSHPVLESSHVHHGRT